jgi:threonine synthase
MYQDTLWSYINYLPLESEKNIVSMGEGKTPLVKSSFFKKLDVYYKLENLNPTGSMKDRAISVGLSKAVELGEKTAALCSTGGAALAMAAYCSRTSIKGFILVPESVTQNLVNLISRFGITIIKVSGTINDCFIVLEKFKKHGVYDLTTTRKANSYQAMAARTIAYECFDSLGRVPDWFIVPVGGGGTLASIWKGFLDIKKRGDSNKIPRMVSVQVDGYNSIQIALKNNVSTEQELLKAVEVLEAPLINVASNITQIYPPDGLDALQAIRESGGKALSVSPDSCLESKDELMLNEGIYAETSSAIVFSAFKKLYRDGVISTDETAILCVTGSGFREEIVSSEVQISKIYKLSPDCSDEELGLLFNI